MIPVWRARAGAALIRVKRPLHPGSGRGRGCSSDRSLPLCALTRRTPPQARHFCGVYGPSPGSVASFVPWTLRPVTGTVDKMKSCTSSSAPPGRAGDLDVDQSDAFRGVPAPSEASRAFRGAQRLLSAFQRSWIDEPAPP